jgi:hypothetical protein
VNWFTADAFCDYHGMHLISFPFGNLDEYQTVKTLMTGKIEITGQDLISLQVFFLLIQLAFGRQQMTLLLGGSGFSVMDPF